MLSKEQLRNEITSTTGLTWGQFVRNPSTLLEQLTIASVIQFDPLQVSCDPTQELWCRDILGLQEGFLGLVGYNPPECPVFFIVYHTGEAWVSFVPEKHNSFNSDTNLAFGVDDVADSAFWSKHQKQYPYPADVKKMKLLIERYFNKLRSCK